MIEWLTALLFLVPATVAAAYYFGFLLVAPLRSTTRPHAKASTKFAILVPAHNEELLLPGTLDSISKLDYPSELFTVFVIADNCTDSTTAIARNRGVTVLERHDSSRRGKGYGLEFALETILPTKPDAVLILDADGELAADALRIFDARLATSQVVQGSIRTRNSGDGPSGLVAAVGNVLDDAISAGRDRLGWPVPLRGSNMAFRREVLEAIPWSCHGLTEDAEYAAKLSTAGIAIRFEPAARARSESPAKMDALMQQRRRWRAAFTLSTMLESKPLVLAQLMLTTLIVAIFREPVFLAWLAVIWLMTVVVYFYALSRIEDFSLRSCLALPRVVVRLALVTLAGPFSRNHEWHRTRRAGEGSGLPLTQSVR